MGDESEKLGLWGAVSISVGGMIGGGVFAVLGVVATIARGAAWLAFTLACLVSMCAAYSYLKLNGLGDNRGGLNVPSARTTGESGFQSDTGIRRSRAGCDGAIAMTLCGGSR